MTYHVKKYVQYVQKFASHDLFEYCQLLKTLGPQSENGLPQLGNKSGAVINVNGFQWNTPLHYQVLLISNYYIIG